MKRLLSTIWFTALTILLSVITAHEVHGAEITFRNTGRVTVSNPGGPIEYSVIVFGAPRLVEAGQAGGIVVSGFRINPGDPIVSLLLH